MTEPNNEVLEVHLTYLREKMDEVVAHLRAQNGTLAAHSTRLAILEDRAAEAKHAAVKWGAGVSAVITGVVTAVYHLFGGK